MKDKLPPPPLLQSWIDRSLRTPVLGPRPLDVDALLVGAEEIDDRPGHAGEGVSVGLAARATV